MEECEQNKVIAFDTLFSTNHISMLKIMLPYLDNQLQKSLAVSIKFLELHYTMDFYRKNPYPLSGCMKKEPAPDFISLCHALLPYCTESEKKLLEQLCSMLQGMETYREMSKTMEMMKDFMPDMSVMGQGEAKPDMMDMLMNLMTPEQKEMFQLFGGNHNDE
jgi:hypothetical protein